MSYGLKLVQICEMLFTCSMSQATLEHFKQITWAYERRIDITRVAAFGHTLDNQARVWFR